MKTRRISYSLSQSSHLPYKKRNQEKKNGLVKKILEVFVFPCHNISGKNVTSIEKVAKPKPNKNSRKTNKARREGACSKTYCLQ
jgi:hypothetical protein